MIYNINLQKIVLVTPKILSEILKEEIQGVNNSYSMIQINGKWLIEVFNFEAKYLAPQYLTVYKSNLHGFKVHEQLNKFSIGYMFKETRNIIPSMQGDIKYKPQIFYVNELMDYLFLIKKEQFEFNEDDLKTINQLILNK
ncbi:hypothetical protein [Tenacibaculum amylolyticum]|uniref:hypothetical protein n=1 Tax=Tenacibaculum amylolyticum TaxID=104269 RepID=UPI0038B4DCAB